MKKIVITKIPLRYFFYFQYLIFGFKSLDRNGEIKFKIKSQTMSEWFLLRFYFLYMLLDKFLPSFLNREGNSFLLQGYFEQNGKKSFFCYDIEDSPHNYDIESLKIVDIYFKAQCPIKFSEKGFPITHEAILPFPQDLFNYIDKISPSMLGPDFGVKSMIGFNKLERGYKKMFVSDIKKSNSLMTFFGNSLGNKEVYVDNPNLFSNESHILGYFKNIVSHPNVKRAIASNMISEMVPDSDARVLHQGNCDSGISPRKNPLFIPMNSFPKHISKFKYNLNISGHRLSIPYRFINSFCVGTAIITDKLKVKWYLPFGSEVYETVEMGYLPPEKVNWNEFKKDILNLPEVDPNDILNAFHNKWSPIAFARFIVNTCQNKIK
jgi:hypothetical protein